MTQDNKPVCNCDAHGVADRVHAFTCPVAQAAMAELQETGEREGVTFAEMRDKARNTRAAALATKTPDERALIEANDKLSDAQIDKMAGDFLGVLKMYDCTRHEARRIINRMQYHFDRSPADKWRNPFTGSGMKLVKGSGYETI